MEWSSLPTAPGPDAIKMFAPRSGLGADLSLCRLYFLFPALQGWSSVAVKLVDSTYVWKLLNTLIALQRESITGIKAYGFQLSTPKPKQFP